jgi:hypothetical protein
MRCERSPGAVANSPLTIERRARISPSLRATSATRAPALSSARVIAAPMPRPAPVTSAVRPVNGMSAMMRAA